MQFQIYCTSNHFNINSNNANMNKFILLTGVLLAISISISKGQFLVPKTLPAGHTYRDWKFKLQDLDQDGRTDIVRYQNNQFSWLKNNGSGSFSPYQIIELPFTTRSRINFARIDSDTFVDLVWPKDKYIYWSKNLGNLTYSAPQVLATIKDTDPTIDSSAWFSGNLNQGDINHDGKTDFYGVGSWVYGGDVSMDFFFRLLSSPSGTYSIQSHFAETTNEEMPGISYREPSNSFNLDASGNQMILANGTLWKLPANDTLYKKIPLPTVPWTYTNQTLYATNIGNWVGDSLADILIYTENENQQTFTIGLSENINGHFATAQNWFTASNSNAGNYQLADIDTDGRPDVFGYNNHYILGWYRNLGNGAFSEWKPILAFPYQGGEFISNVGDLTGDMKPDLLTTNLAPYNLKLYQWGIDSLANFSGRIYSDTNSNCNPDEIRIAPYPAIMKINPGNLIRSTSQFGSYSFQVPEGTYETRILNNPPFLTDSICYPSGPEITIDSSLQTKIQDIGIQGPNCPYLVVDAVMGNSAPCLKSRHGVFVKNIGSRAAKNVELRIKLPQYSIYKSHSGTFYSTFSFDTINGEYVFKIGYLGSQYTMVIEIRDSTKCLTGIDSLSQCLEARVNYASACLPVVSGWDGSNLIPELASLSPGQTRITITNSGQNMTDSTSFQLLRNHQSVYSQKIKLVSGASAVYIAPVASSDLHLLVQQRPHHPNGLYFSAVDGRNDSLQPQASERFYSGNRPDKAISCRMIQTGADTSMKSVFPSGWETSHSVLSQTPLIYKVKFKNRLTSTGVFVDIRDTLSSHLDLTTFRLIGSSFSDGRITCTFEGNIDTPVVVFTIPDLYLSNISASAYSQGFVAYSIQPKPGLPQGTEILNSASFFINDETNLVHTNRTLTTINDSIPVGIPLILQNSQPVSNSHFKVFPNPGSGHYWIDKGSPEGGLIQVFNSKGQISFETTLEDGMDKNPIRFSVPPGFYVVRFTNKKGTIWQKLMVEQ